MNLPFYPSKTFLIPIIPSLKALIFSSFLPSVSASLLCDFSSKGQGSFLDSLRYSSQGCFGNCLFTSARYIPLQATSSELLKNSSLNTVSWLLVMKILQANAGALTNFEVLDFLRSRGAGRDPTRIIVPVLPSEFKVYDYLEQTAACNQTRRVIDEFLGKCKSIDLAKAETLNIINIRPSSLVELYPIIEEYDTRFGEAAETMEEFVETVVQLLPPPPNQMQSEEEEGTSTDQKEAPDEEKTEAAE